MPKKIPYFVNTGGKPKFKRAVPTDIRAVVGKQNWVRSVGSLAPSQLKAEGNLFAVYTDAEIDRYRQQLGGNAKTSPGPEKISLNSTDVDAIISRYRNEREMSRLLNRSLLLSGDRPVQDVLDDAHDDLQNVMNEANGETSISEDHTVRLLQRYGYAEETQGWSELRRIADALESNVEFQRLVRLKEFTDIQLAQERLKVLSSRDFTGLKLAPVASVSASSDRKMGKNVSLKNLADSYLASKPSNLTISRRSQLKLAIDILLEWFGNEAQADKIGRDQCKELVGFIPRIPAYRAQHYKGLTLQEAVDAHLQKHGAYADRREEGQKYVEIARSIFQFAKHEQWIDGNPWDGLEITRKSGKKYLELQRTYQPFPIGSLNKLFSLPIWLADDDGQPTEKYFLTHRYWAPIIALYSGMRMNEVLQLEKADIQTDGSVSVFSVTDEESGEYDPKHFSKRVKTENSIRRVPVHPKLAEVGFLKWVGKAKDGRLFPEAAMGAGEKPSDLYSKRFHTDLKNAGIWEPRRQVFHSFRNNFNDALRAAGTPLELREAINGWTRQRSMDGAYGSGHTDQMLYGEVCKAHYPGLNIAALERNAKFI